MSGKALTHSRVVWVSGIIRKIHATRYAIDMTCTRCGERQHMQYCCFDKARDLGLECFAKLHFLCTEKLKTETIL